MSDIHVLRVFLTKRLAAAADEIFGVVEKTIVEYQEEVVRLQSLLDIVLQPQIKTHGTDIQQLTHSASKPFLPPEQQLHSEQEWSSSHGQEDPEPTQIKKELEELWTSQEDNQLQGLEADNNDSNPAFVKGDYYGEQTEPSHLYQAQKEGNGERNFLPKTTSEQIKTEPDGQDYRESEPTSVSQPLSSVNLECSAGQSENSEIAGSVENEEPQSHIQTHTKAIEGGFCRNTFCPATDSTPPVQTHIAPVLRCHVCGKGFSKDSALLMHIRRHTGEKYLSCPLCGKSFKQKGNLKRHLRIHTGEKPYRCCHCGKGFNQSGSLSSHMRSHTGEKPFHCTDCGREFSNSSNLTKHTRIHTGEKPFCCPDCGKSFSRRERLKNHMTTHAVQK